MTRKKLSPMDIFPLLSGINCKDCGEENCLAFAMKLANREVTLEKCALLLTKEHAEAYDKLKNLLRPPVREVTVGIGERAVKIGGKLTVYRHESGFANPTAIAVDVSDELGEKELIDRVRRIDGFAFEYIGQRLKLDLVAIRCTSNNAERFKKAVEIVCKSCGLPVVLCSLDPKVLEAGLLVVSAGKPLLCAATIDNWREMGKLVLRFGCALVVSGGGDLKLLRGLVDSLLKMGVGDLVLDPGTLVGDGLGQTLDSFVVLRRMACDVGDGLFGFPLLGVPLSVWLDKTYVSEDIRRWREVYIADMLLTRSADLLIMHSLEGWALLPLVVLRQNLYIDPRKPVAVAAGLREFGCVGADVPVLLTTNFALTYFTVASDLERAGVSAYLLVVDTGGIAVDSSVAGRRLTAEKIASAVRASGIAEKVKHRKIVIPGKASRLSADVEKLIGWQVIVGPKDSSNIGKFLQEKWHS